MKIALLGYGKMGKVIERIALERGHEIILKKSRNATFESLEKADVAIDFSIPNAAVENISTCFENGIPVDLCQTDMRDAWEYLGEITGDSYKDELLDELFSKFCLGK